MIGIFDSGIGGITVAKEIKKVLPKVPIIYFGDTARLPYGNRSAEIIKKYARESVEFLVLQGAKAIVAACNSASTVIDDEFKNQFSVPIFEVISPAAEAGARATKNKRVGVIGTRATVNSGVYETKIKELDGQIKVYSKACPLFVALVEENWIKKQETKMIARRYLQELKRKGIDTLILGCTHYPLLKEVIKRVMGKSVRLIDPAEEMAKMLMTAKIETNGEEFGFGDRYYVSDLTANFQNLAERWLREKCVPLGCPWVAF